ncbi:hypothetical protein AAZX31_03G159200 [Glycine max]|nr:hypothetical protein GLYMA_03G178133v4 [Glycine max]KAG4393842.1 hypothetical protein GLYMA_03G178133v4 [Glycine max]KAH1070563.1 hypothetical protein GYH30_007572 [Glycine max]KAH1070564.1 hypothetical protein GYH30_007572 [Glycine max]
MCGSYGLIIGANIAAPAISDLYISQRGVLATSNTKSFQKGERPAILSGIYLSEAQESIADELKFRLG